MKLTNLTLSHFRNFCEYEFTPGPHFNLIVANNGDGKTSLLEAIYFLGMGRSFRSNHYQTMIQREQRSCQIIAHGIDEKETPFLLGIEKHTEASQSQLKMNGVSVTSHLELAKQFPVQLIFHETFHLLDAGPQHRREFIDWGVFYTELNFYTSWQHFQRALKQRNALLKNMDSAQCDFWEQELAYHAIKVDHLRRLYLTLFLPVLEEIGHNLGFADKLSIQYASGWDQERDYLSVLKQARPRDSILGYTQYGPHRADLKIKVHGVDADQVLSRGQQKMLSFAMKVAQALLLSRLNQQHCLFLVDDLAAELDAQHIHMAIEILKSLQSQIFLTAIHQSLFASVLEDLQEKFHVEHIAQYKKAYSMRA